MRSRFSFTLKITLPYLIVAALFLGIFLVDRDDIHTTIAWISAAGIILSILGGILNLIWFNTPLIRIRNLLIQLSVGKMPEFSAAGSKDEIGDLEGQLDKHVKNLRKISQFLRSLSSGDFTEDYTKLSNEDELGESLLTLKESLMESQKDSELRRREEENRSWSAHGLAKFSTLFREAEDNLQELSLVLMKELVEYTEADVGLMFIVVDEIEDQNQVLQLFGSYAFDREKHLERNFSFGEGLVGRAAVEKEVIYVTELPADYMKIRSGLGEDVPASLLLVPVMLDNNVLGVMELASLVEIPSYQRDFVKQLSDALATTLAKIKANLQTKILFEQSKKQAEELASQDMVFRQKLDKLERSRDEYLIKEEKLRKEIELLRKGSD